MNIFRKLFSTSQNTPSSKEETSPEKRENSSLDDLFVQNFINKGGKFIYCLSKSEALDTLKKITVENNWNQLSCFKENMVKVCKETSIFVSNSKYDSPFFTTCEHLISDSGNILLSSNQLGEMKLRELNEHFIVVAYTSQMVKNTGEGLTGIKSNNQEKIPANICEIKGYSITQNKDNNFMNYGLTNSKNLYLILIEDL